MELQFRQREWTDDPSDGKRLQCVSVLGYT